jgi:flagellar assembly protein FliH
MLCKLLEGHEAHDVQPLEWRDPNASPDPEPAATTEPADPATDPEHKVDWQARLAEVESRWQSEAKAQYQKGHRDGMTAGKQAEAAALKPVLEKLSASLAELSGWRDKLRRAAEADLVKLAIAIARRVLHREIGVDPDALGALVRHALERLRGHDICRVRAHPDHAAVIGALLAARNAAATVEADVSLAPGSVLFETAMGSLDVSVETQLAEIERGLADRLEGAL